MNDDERQSIRRLKLMKDLVDTPAWKELENILASQVEYRKNLILAPAGDTPEYNPLKVEYLKGAMYGIQLALETPRSIITDGKAIVAELSEPSDQMEMFDE